MALLIYFQLDKDWHYRSEERRWVALNDKSQWRKADLANGKVTISHLTQFQHVQGEQNADPNGSAVLGSESFSDVV